MAFIVEDGSGIPGANAGIDVAFADTYHEERGNATWGLFPEDVKKQLIIKATDYVRDVYGASLGNVPKSPLQGWVFPRFVFGYPEIVKQVVAELALIAKGTPLLVNSPARGKKMVKVGSLQVEYDPVSPGQAKFITASLRMAPFLVNYGASAVMVPLRRV